MNVSAYMFDFANKLHPVEFIHGVVPETCIQGFLFENGNETDGLEGLHCIGWVICIDVIFE